MCNTVIGSINPFTGQVEYTDYGYLLAKWTVYSFEVIQEYQNVYADVWIRDDACSPCKQRKIVCILIR